MINYISERKIISFVITSQNIGLLRLHLWRHSRTPLEPHQQLAEEAFEDYE